MLPSSSAIRTPNAERGSDRRDDRKNDGRPSQHSRSIPSSMRSCHRKPPDCCERARASHAKERAGEAARERAWSPRRSPSAKTTSDILCGHVLDALVVAGVLILVRMLAVSSRSGTLILAAVLALGGGSRCSRRRGRWAIRDHLAMATAFAHASAPPPASDARRSWFYALTAAPLFRERRRSSIRIHGTESCVLAAAAVVLVKRVSTVGAGLLIAGPILWWIDKPHPEVLTFGLIAIAFACISTAPWMTILALGLATAQEPVIAPASWPP